MAQNQQSEHQTVDGQKPVDDKIDNMPDATADEAARNLTMLQQAADAANASDAAQSGAKPKDTKDGLEYVDDPRASIYKAAAENRGKPIAPEQVEDVDPNSAAARYGADAVTSTPADQQQQTQQQGADDEILNRKVKVKINGVEQEVALKDAVTNYQKVQAGDVYLRQAKETAEQIVNSARAIATPAGGASTQPDAGRPANAASDASTDDDGQAPIPKGTKLSRDKLANVVEAISLGSTDEGVKALTDLVEAVQPDPTEIANQVQTRLALKDIEKVSVDATQAFLEKYPAFATDDVIQNVTGQLLTQEMIKDFVAAGANKEELTKIADDRRKVKALHDHMRIQNPNFGRSLDKLYDAVAQTPHFVKLAGEAKPVDVQVDRGARKVLLPPQPVPRTPPNMPGGQQQQPENRQASLSRGYSQIMAGRVHQPRV